MVILDDIRSNLDDLASHLKGRRVGLYPGDYARFAHDKHLFDGIEVLGTYGGGAGWQDFGFKCFYDRKQFLDAIDVCLFCGLDGSQDVLFDICISKMQIEIIDLQNGNGKWSLNRPRRSISTYDLSLADDRKALEQFGVVCDHFISLTENDVLWKDVYRNEGRLTPFDRVVAETGEAVAHCPFCGRLCRTRQSLPVLDLALVIFYRFLCCQEFYVLKYIPQVWGLYIPKLETIIDFTSCYPGLEQSWKYGHLWHYVDLLKVQATYCLKSLESYCEDTEDYARVSFVGIHQNIGHHGLHELGGVQFCIDKCFQSALDNVMIVAVDLLDFRALFPEVKSFKNLEGQDTKRRRSNAFQYILNNRLTGSFIYYYGPFMEKVAERILTESRGRYEASLQKTLEVSHVNARWPVLWVTLRSKRRWVDQIDGIASVLNELYMDYPDILVVFDGLPEDESLLLQVLFKMNDGIVVHNALHSELYNTVFLVSKCDMCISPFGAGGFFTSFIANLPGIYYGSVGFLKQSCFIFEGDASPAQPRENFRQSVIIHAYWEDNDADPSVRDYKLRWEEVLVASKELLSSMSDKRM